MKLKHPLVAGILTYLLFYLLSAAAVLITGVRLRGICIAAALYLLSLFVTFWLFKDGREASKLLIRNGPLAAASLFCAARLLMTMKDSYSASLTSGSFSLLALVMIITMFYGLAAFVLTVSLTDFSFEKSFAVQGLVFGTVMCMIFPLNGIADEPQHMRTAYNLSNILMRIPSEENGIYMRTDDALFDMRYPDYNIDDFNRYLQEMKQPLNNDELMLVPDDTDREQSLDYSRRPKIFDTEWYQYLAVSAGITLGRILHTNTIIMYLLGRFFNLFMYILAIWLALKIMPIGKSALYTASLMPMSLQLAASCSRDAFRISCAALVFALTLYYFHGNIETKTKKLITLTALLVFSALLIPLRTYVYSVIAMIAVFMFFWQKKWIGPKGVRNILIGLTAIVAVLLLVKYIFFPGQIVNEPESYLTYMRGLRYTKEYFINQPLEIFNILRRTLRFHGGWYIETMIGSTLGWLDFGIPMVYIHCFFILLIVSAFRRSYEETVLEGPVRLVINLFCMLSVCLIILGLTLTWTPLYSLIAEGVQGRYFLPVLVPFLISFRGSSVTAEKKCDVWCMSIQFAALILSVNSLMIYWL